MGSRRQDHFVNLERKRRDQVVNVHTTHTSRSQSRSGSHLSHKENIIAMQPEIDHLKRKLRHEQRRRTPSNSDFSFDVKRMVVIDPGQGPPSESFSCEGNYHHGHRNKFPSRKGLGNDAMSKALNQISKSPFTHRIEGGRLPQPTFAMYNCRTDAVKHVSHFN